MRIRFTFEIRIERSQRTEPSEPQFEHRDNDGTLVESTGPFYRDDSERAIPDIQLGFQPNRYSERSQQLAGILRDKALKNLGR